MAKYHITHSCGHDATHQIYGTNSNGERDRKEQWLQSTLCRDCWIAEKAKERAAENARAKEIATVQALPALSGSDKQIAWAESIRVSTLEGALKMAPTDDHKDNCRTVIGKVTSARWWIDHRGHSIESIVESIIDLYKIELNVPKEVANA